MPSGSSRKMDNDILYRSLQQLTANTSKCAVAIVKMAADKSMNKCLSSQQCQTLFDRPELMQLNAGPTECLCVVGHGERTIKENAKVIDNLCKLHCDILYSHHVSHEFILIADMFPAR